MTYRLTNPDSIDWGDTRQPVVRQRIILDALEGLFAGPKSMDDVFRELRSEPVPVSAIRRVSTDAGEG